MVEVKNVSKQYGGKPSLRKRLYPFKRAGSPHLSVRTAREKAQRCLS
ncbi:hypothetical protein QNN00_01300 [Bacillus velezensis]|nr:hypothetical protein [Bacillus velezensis]